MTVSINLRCPCGSLSSKNKLAEYAQCCGRYIDGDGTLSAPTALLLMRSRYAAFVLKNESYLLDTWAQETRPVSVDFAAGLKWLGLDIKQHTQQDEHSATVEFVARFRQDGKGGRLHELSRFVRREGRWYYRDGEHSQA